VHRPLAREQNSSLQEQSRSLKKSSEVNHVLVLRVHHRVHDVVVNVRS